MKNLFLKIFPIFLLFSFHFAGITQSRTVRTITLGQDTVQLIIYEQKGGDHVFIHVHENETASLQAGLQALSKYGGKLVTLAHSFDGTKNRNVTFRLGKNQYVFDPNRIFTKDMSVLTGSISLVKGKGKVDGQITGIADRLAKAIWNELEGYPLIIALHNNKNMPAQYKTRWLFWKHIEPESYSITSYVRKFDQSSDSGMSCSDIYINPSINNSEFFIVTQRADFDLLYRLRYNAVLQNQNPVDDGSLSVFAAKKGIRYINAEAKHGRVSEQSAMLNLLLGQR